MKTEPQTAPTTTRYAKVVENSRRIRWDIDKDVFRGRTFDFSGHFLPDDSPPVRNVRRVLGRLARASEIEPLQDEINLTVIGYRFEWEGHVIKDNTVNAFCLPAGKVFVFTGILNVAVTDNLLATVLAHEIAHALAHHASERIAREKTARGILRSLRYGRMQETEADRIGVFLMAFADFDPRQAAVFWERMRAARGAGGESSASRPSAGFTTQRDASRRNTLPTHLYA